MKTRISSIWLTLVVSLVIVAPVWARIITVEVTGVVDGVGTHGGLALDGSVDVGSIMTGTTTYDTDTPDLRPSEYNGKYALISISMTVGNYTFTYDPMSSTSAFFEVHILSSNSYSYGVRSLDPRFDGTVYIDGSPKTFDEVNLDPFGLNLMKLVDPDSIITDELPSSFPDLSTFTSERYFGTGVDSPPEAPGFAIWGEITSLTVVPEPGTYYVDADATGANDGSSWEDAYNYLQDALAAASSSDEIWVAEGIYKPDKDTIHPGSGDREATFQLKNSVVIKGGYAGFGEPDPNARDVELYETTLSGDLNGDDVGFTNNGDNSYHVVTGSETNATAILDGFTITAGNANTWSDDGGSGMYNSSGSPIVRNCTFRGNRAYGGGGMYNGSSSPTVTNCTFSGNWTIMSGGGMYNHRSSPTLNNCTFSGNSADYGGGLLNYSDSNPAVTNCTFSDNTVVSWGGGMGNVFDSSPTLTNCAFSENSAQGNGGGMFNYGERGACSPTLTNCTFSGNSAGDRGGGMFNYVGGNPTLTNCTFSGNSADSGGGMANKWNSPTVTNCTFSGNSSQNYGGGMYNEFQSSPTLTNCTFAENSAINGTALAFDSQDQEFPSNVQLSNCILWDGGNEFWNNDGSTITITYSDVQGGWPGEGNINADPCFVDPDSNDFHLLAGSPCIDAGDNMAVPADTTDLDGDGNTTEPIPFDLDGNPRIVDGNDDGIAVVDMGAFEAMVSCFGINHVKLETKAGKKGNKVELKGTFSPALPIDFAVDDVAYIIDDGQGYMLGFLIPAGSFEPDGKPDKQKFKFDSPKHSEPDIKAKFDFDKCKFELKVKKVSNTDEITSTTLTIELWAGANVAQEVVELEVKGKKGEHLEYKRKPKFECCPKCKGIALMEVTSDQGVLVFEPDPGKEKLKRKTVVDDGVNGRVKIDTSCSKPLEVGDVFGVYTVTDLIKIFDDWPDDENDE